MMSLKIVRLLMILSLALLAACEVTEELHPDFEPLTKDEGGGSSGGGTLSGEVRNAQGNPVAPTILYGDVTDYGEPDGGFNVGGIPDGTEAFTVTSAGRYSSCTRPLQIADGEWLHYPDITVLTMPTAPAGVFFGDAGGEAVASDGTGAIVPAEALADTGQVFTDRCGVFAVKTTALDDHFLSAAPGLGRGVQADGTEVALRLEGVLWTLLVGIGASGPLEIIDGQSIVVSMGLPAEQLGDAPTTIDAWQMDTATGLWTYLETVDLVDGAYRATVTSLAPVGWASVVSEALCEISGRITDQHGTPMASARVQSNSLDGRYRTDAFTDENGEFTVRTLDGVGAELLPLVSDLSGATVTVEAGAACPVTLSAPLPVSIPEYSIDLVWGITTDLDSHFYLGLGDHLSYLDFGSLDASPFILLENDDRTGATGESILGRRYQPGINSFWVHAYELRSSGDALSSAALVSLDLGDTTYTFDIGDVPFPYHIIEEDTTVADSLGWWHVFDLEVVDHVPVVTPVQMFEAPPLGLKAGRGK